MNISYESFSSSGTEPVDAPERRWWTLSGDAAAHAVSEVLGILMPEAQSRADNYTLSERLYGKQARRQRYGMHISPQGRLSYNVTASCIDTLVSRIAKNQPRPLFVTSNGKHRNRTKAKLLNSFVEGVFNECGVYALGRQVCRDALVWGDGFLHVYERDGRVAVERVKPLELWVDEVEAEYGQPRQLHRVRIVDRLMLEEAFPEHAARIRQADSPTYREGMANVIADAVTVRESWHLRSSEEAQDGKHIISLDGVTLLEEDWDADHFPFARFTWSAPLTGWYGEGLAEQLRPTQLEINSLLGLIQRSNRLGGSFKVLVETSSKIVNEHLNNDVGTIIRYTGNPPQYITPPQVQPELYKQVADCIQRAYMQSGISELSAGGNKPAGVTAARALRELTDIESDRFATVGKDYDDFFVQLGKLTVETAKRIAASGEGYQVETRSLNTIDWKDIALRDDTYEVRVFSVSSLSRDPVGRYAQIEEFTAAGFYTPRQARRLFELPDVARVENLANAAEDYLTMILDKMVDEGEYTPPEPLDDLELALELGLQYYQEAKAAELEEERLELLRTFLSQVEAELSETAPIGAEGEPGMEGPAVPGGPEAEMLAGAAGMSPQAGLQTPPSDPPELTDFMGGVPQ